MKGNIKLKEVATAGKHKETAGAFKRMITDFMETSGITKEELCEALQELEIIKSETLQVGKELRFLDELGDYPYKKATVKEFNPDGKQGFVRVHIVNAQDRQFCKDLPLEVVRKAV